MEFLLVILSFLVASTNIAPLVPFLSDSGNKTERRMERGRIQFDFYCMMIFILTYHLHLFRLTSL